MEKTKAKIEEKKTIKVNFLYPIANVSSLSKIDAIINGLTASLNPIVLPITPQPMPKFFGLTTYTIDELKTPYNTDIE